MTPVAISNQWISGASTPTYLMVQSITVDGQSCGNPVDNRMSCGSTGVVVQYTADNSEAPSASQSNISGSYLVEGGAYAGHYFCQAQAQCFEGPFNNFILVTPGTSTSTCSNACHVVSMTMQGTDSSQNNVGPPATVTYSFSVLPPPTFQPVAPTTYPPIPGMSNYWAYLASYGQTQGQCGSDCYGVQSVVQMLNAELNPRAGISAATTSQPALRWARSASGTTTAHAWLTVSGPSLARCRAGSRCTATRRGLP